MRARIASTVTLWLVVMAALYFARAWGGLAFIVLLGAAAQWEFYRLLETLGAKPRKALGVIAGSALPMLTFCKGAGLLGDNSRAFDPNDGVGKIERWFRSLSEGTSGASVHLRDDLSVFALVGIAVAVLFLGQLVKRTAPLAVLRRMPTLFGVLGFPFMFALYAWPAGIHWGAGGDAHARMTGVYWVVWCAAATKFTDVGGLLAGRAFGKNKLWPAVSPGKTWEGCAGGVLTSALVGALSAWLFGSLGWSIALSPLKAALVALPLAILSVPSDLVESVFKRLADVKDSGKTIPGIGGAYDLVDSLLLTAPVSLLLYLAVTA